MKKKVQFSNEIEEFITYSYKDYDRSININRYSSIELYNIFMNLDLYKIYEMPVHIDSIINNSYHKKFLDLNFN